MNQHLNNGDNGTITVTLTDQLSTLLEEDVYVQPNTETEISSFFGNGRSVEITTKQRMS